MKNKFLHKKLSAVFTAMLITILLIPFSAAAEISGPGWSFNSTTGELIVSSNEGTTAWRISVTDNPSVISAVIEEGVTEIGNSAFFSCRGLTNLTLPASLEYIGNAAFWGCVGLNEVVFNENSQLTTIGINAFRNCTGLAMVFFPEFVEHIGGNAFVGCAGINKFEVHSNNLHFSNGENGELFNKDLTKLVLYPYGKETVNYIVPSTVNIIGEFAFAYSSNLESISLPASLESIGDYAFWDCNKITEIVFEEPSQIKAIGEWAFRGCTELKNLTLPASLESIGNIAFYGCNKITEIVFEEPSQIKSIGIQAFSGCTELKNLTLPASLESIGNSAFSGCNKITEIVFEEQSHIKYIGLFAFRDCTGLTNLTLPASLESIGDGAFWGCTGLTTLILPASLESIGNNAFNGCKKITEIVFKEPFQIKSIGEWAFWGCTELTNLTLPASLESIGDGVFYGCNKITEIVFGEPSQIKSIGAGAFRDCTELQNLTLPASLESIGNDAFRDCTGLTNLTLPASLESIGNNAFNGCNKITGIVFEEPSRIKNIGNDAFRRCTGLTNLTLPASIESIGNNAFNGCNEITEIVFEVPSQIKTIGNDAFSGCTGLTNLTLPASLESIGHGAFSECENLVRFDFLSVVPLTFGDFVFHNVPALSVYVPVGASYNVNAFPSGSTIYQGYALTVENGSGSKIYSENEEVTITANSATIGKLFDKWTTDNSEVVFGDENSTTTTFTMPAANVTVTANYDSYFASGNGSPSSPFEIATAEQLHNMSYLVNNENDEYGDKHYVLADNITMNDVADWESWDVSSDGLNNFISIGTPTNVFNGVFDGQGYEITGLYSSHPTTAHGGLFGQTSVDAEIRNFGLTKSFISAESNTGGIVGINYASIDNCYFKGKVEISLEDGWNAGGFVGDNFGVITNSYSNATVKGHAHVGGFVGRQHSENSLINSSYSAGEVSGNNRTGGFVGRIWAGTIEYCYSKTEIMQGSSQVGGFVGLVRQNVAATIKGNFSTGSVLGATGIFVGSFDGNGTNITLERNYYLGTEDGDVTVNGTQRTEETMKSAAFIGDINGTGSGFIHDVLNVNAGFPMLQTFAGTVLFSGGDGSADFPYKISTAKQLRNMSHLVNNENLNFGDKHYVLTNDIALNDTDNWQDWGSEDNEGNIIAPANEWIAIGVYTTWLDFSQAFKGTFDGQGFEISGIYINTDLGYQGLFGYVYGGTIKNVGVIESYIKGGTWYVGGVVGQNIDGSISNSYNTGTVEGNNSVGGVVGWNNGSISNSYFLQGSASSGIGANYGSGTAISKTQEEFTSGLVARLLQDSQEEFVWGHSVLNNVEFPRLAFESDDVKQVFEVIFNVEYELHAKEFALNASAVAFPDEPVSTGFSFVGWSKAGGDIFTQHDVVTSDLLLTALFDVANNFPETNALSQVTTYPNPFTNKITLDYVQSITRVIILNLAGMVVVDELLHGEPTHTITCNLPSGIYMLVMYDNSGNHEVKKMVRN